MKKDVKDKSKEVKVKSKETKSKTKEVKGKPKEAKSKNPKKKAEYSNQPDVNRALIENFVNLQKVLTNLAVKFEDLSGNISKLLQLFELSAKSFADKPIKTPGIDEEFLKKLDSLLDQNKTISKGIMMMEERVRNRSRPPMPRGPEQRFGGFAGSPPR